MSLFTDPEPDILPQAARLAPLLRALASEGIYFGTNSWKYVGWLGTIYAEVRYKTRDRQTLDFYSPIALFKTSRARSDVLFGAG